MFFGESTETRAARESYAVQRGEHFADADRGTLNVALASVGGGRRHLTGNGRRRHLTARHAVNAVVDEDHRDVFAARRRVNGFRRADRREVAVALIGEDDRVGMGALDAGRDCRSSAMRRFDHVAFKIVVGKDGASDRRDADGVTEDAELVDGFRHETVDDAVRTAGAVVQRDVGQRLRTIKYSLHGCICILS